MDNFFPIYQQLAYQTRKIAGRNKSVVFSCSGEVTCSNRKTSRSTPRYNVVSNSITRGSVWIIRWWHFLLLGGRDSKKITSIRRHSGGQGLLHGISEALDGECSISRFLSGSGNRRWWARLFEVKEVLDTWFGYRVRMDTRSRCRSMPKIKGVYGTYFGNLGTIILSGAPVRARRNSSKSAFSSTVRPKGLMSGLRCGLSPPP
jgi:hypothetical protein